MILPISFVSKSHIVPWPPGKNIHSYVSPFNSFKTYELLSFAIALSLPIKRATIGGRSFSSTKVFGSGGAIPPLTDAISTSNPASINLQYGVAISS